MARKKMWFATPHHGEWITPPLTGADMSPASWGEDGTYLSGGGFVRQSADSHRQYIFEWGGSSSRQAAETMQRFRDGVYSKSSRDLMYFYDPNIYDRNILPKRWAQPSLLAPETGASKSVLGTVSRVDTPPEWVKEHGLPMQGVEVASTLPAIPSDSQLNPSNSLHLPIPPGYDLHIQAFTEGTGSLRLKAPGFPAAATVPTTFTSSLFSQVTLFATGNFHLYGARAVLVPTGGALPSDWAAFQTFQWAGTPGESASVTPGTPPIRINEVFNGGFEYQDGGGAPLFWEDHNNLGALLAVDITHPAYGSLFGNVGGPQGSYVGYATSASGSGLSIRTSNLITVTSGNSYVGVSAVASATEGVSQARTRVGVRFTSIVFPNDSIDVWGPWYDAASAPGDGVVMTEVLQDPGPNYRRAQILIGSEGSTLMVDKVIAVYGADSDSVEARVQTYRDGDSTPLGAKWTTGLGHSGCSFVGNPTWVANTGVNGGQVGYAATLKEVGDWLV